MKDTGIPDKYQVLKSMPIPKTIEGILFDLDGTLIRLPNLDKFFDDLLVEILREYKVTVPEEGVRLALWHSGGDFEKIIRSWGIDDYDAFIHNFAYCGGAM